VLLYLAHPVSGDPVGNSAKAERWVRWCIDAFEEHDITAPWITYVRVLDDDNQAHRFRGLSMSLAAAARCDGIILCGGRVTNGMAMERDAIVGRHLGDSTEDRVFDLTPLGLEPPVGVWTLDQFAVWPQRARVA